LKFFDQLNEKACDSELSPKFENPKFVTFATGDAYIRPGGETYELCKTIISSNSSIRFIVKDATEKSVFNEWCPVDVTTIGELEQYLPEKIGDIDVKQVLDLMIGVAQSDQPKFAYDILLLLIPFLVMGSIVNADWLPGKGGETLSLINQAAQICDKSGSFILKNIMSPYCIQNDSFRKVAQLISIQKLNGILEDVDSGKDIIKALISNSVYEVSGDLAGLLSAVPQVYPGFLDFNNPQHDYIVNAHFSDGKRQEMNRQLQDVFPYKTIHDEGQLPKYENKIDILYNVFGEDYDFYKTFLYDLDIEVNSRRDQNNDDKWLNAIHQFSNMLKDYPDLKGLTGKALRDRIDQLKLEYDQKLENKNGGFLIWELAYLRGEVVSRILEEFLDSFTFNNSLSDDSYKKAAIILYNFTQAIKERNPDFPLSGKDLRTIFKTSADNKFTESGIFRSVFLTKISPHIKRLIQEFEKIKKESI
ncbi:MAG: hypothetical protein VW397_02605, partial [Candidatus Margulisiibacteriota bacterium]